MLLRHSWTAFDEAESWYHAAASFRRRSRRIFKAAWGLRDQARGAQLVESELPKLKVAGSIPVARSNRYNHKRLSPVTQWRCLDKGPKPGFVSPTHMTYP